MNLQLLLTPIIAIGDMNAHLPEDEPYTGRKPDLAGRSWTDITNTLGLRRLLPGTGPRWTFYSMTKQDYLHRRQFDTEEGKSVVDLAAASNEATSMINKFWLNFKDFFRTDHVGLCLNIEIQEARGESPFRPKPIMRRKFLTRHSAEAEAYALASEKKLRVWCLDVEASRSRWKDPNYVQRLIKRLENDLIESMNSVNPESQVKEDKARVENNKVARVSAIAQLQSLAREDQRSPATILTYRVVSNADAQLEVDQEEKEFQCSGQSNSDAITQDRHSVVWRSRRQIISSFRPNLPRSFFNANGNLLFRTQELLGEVRSQVSQLCDPVKKFNVGVVDAKFKKKIQKRHRQLRRLAAQSRDWKVTEEDELEMFKYFLDAYQKKGAGGPSGVQAMMVALAGPSMRKAIRLVLELIQSCGKIPPHWLYVLLALILKAGLPGHVLQSYRPIALAELFLKGLERAMKIRYDLALTLRPLHPSIMAYRKGISTGIALFTLTEACLEAELDNIKVSIVANDIVSAYNGTERDRVEVLEWDHLKIQGQLWEMMRQLASEASYRTMFHGHLTPPAVQKGGYMQGKSLSPTHFNTGFHPILVEVERAGGGVNILGRNILGVCWSDDNWTIARDEVLERVTSATEQSFGKNGAQAKSNKQYIVKPGRRGRRWALGSSTPDVKTPDQTSNRDWFCSWSVKHHSAKFAGDSMEVRHSARMLGRLVGPTLQRHPSQALWAKRKAESAIKYLGWMGAFSATADTNLARMLYTYLVESVLVSAVLNTQLTSNDFNELRILQARVARRAVWAGPLVSKMVIIRELGWTLVDAPIWKSKLGLHETLKSLPSSEIASTVLAARMRSVRDGRDDRGLCAEVKGFWERAGHPQGFLGVHKESKATRKKRLRPIIRTLLGMEWEQWCKEHAADNGQYDLLAPKLGERAEHIANGTKKEIGLMTTARAGQLYLKPKLAGKKSRPSSGLCHLCDGKHIEDEGHVLLVCSKYDAQRHLLMAGWESACSADQWNQFSDALPQEQKLFLLGMRLGEDDNPQSRKARDLAVKAFLVSVNDLRKQEHGLPDLCGKVRTHVECSLAEAQVWQEQAEKALEQLEELYD